MCHQLGYQQALAITTGAFDFGPGSGLIHFQNVTCQGSESNLFMCPLSRDTTSCSHSQDVGVICTGRYNTFPIVIQLYKCVIFHYQTVLSCNHQNMVLLALFSTTQYVVIM